MKYTNYILTIAFLAFSISCSTAANQTNAVSQNAPDSGTALGFTNNETSEGQTAAPDAVVKELLKLHNADKSPLYNAKNRAEMEKFFAKDFVNLVWTGSSEPNLMNKLAIDGDLLLGLDPLSKSEGETVRKTKMNGDQATVPVTINVIDSNDEKSKNLYDYELVKEKAGWRVSNIKFGKSGSLIDTINDLKKTAAEGNKEFEKEMDEKARSDKPPFVGTRWFEINKGVSGSGTPQFYLKINENNYAFCGFVQTNQADGTEQKEEVALGPFKNKFDCNFKNTMGGTHTYQIKGNYIYELDKNNQVGKAEVCCPTGSDSESCECKSEFFK